MTEVKRTVEERVPISDSFGVPHNLPPIPLLFFAKYENITAKIQNRGKDLNEYHQTTRYRLDIAAYCLKLMMDNYNNDIAFAAGLTGFLVQGKSCLDSLCQELNLFYGLNLVQPPFAIDTEDLLNPNHLQLLSIKSLSLSQFLTQELSSPDAWYTDFKKLRDSEGVHRSRAPRLIRAGVPAHDIEINGKKVAEFCVESVSKINKITEGCYGLI
jgi:hypothetical protein